MHALFVPRTLVIDLGFDLSCGETKQGDSHNLKIPRILYRNEVMRALVLFHTLY